MIASVASTSSAAIKINGKCLPNDRPLQAQSINQTVASTSSTAVKINEKCVPNETPLDLLFQRFSNIVIKDAVETQSNGREILYQTKIIVNGQQFEGSGII